MKSTKRNPQRKRKQKLKRLRLSKRDMRILSHVQTYGMTWFDVLHRVFFPGKHPNAVKSTLRRLCGRGYDKRVLYAHAMDSRRVCYQLTLAGTRALEASPELARSFGRTAIARRYALQSFLCLDGSATRAFIHNADIAAKFPTIDRRLPQANFYKAKSRSGVVRLGYAVIDYGSDVRRAVGRVLKRRNDFVESGWFDGLIASQAFEFSVLTLSEGKSQAIQRKLRNHCEAENGQVFLVTENGARVPLNFIIVDGLIELIPNPRK